jgi:hypothetical protein
MKFIYDGPVSGVTLKVGEQKIERMLNPGCEVDLPEEHPQVILMGNRGHLRRIETVQQNQAEQPVKTRKTKGGNE